MKEKKYLPNILILSFLKIIKSQGNDGFLSKTGFREWVVSDIIGEKTQ